MSTDTTTRPRAARRAAVWAVARFEGRNRVPVTLVITALVTVYAAMFLWLGPTFVAEEAVTDLLDSLPPVLNELFGFESLASLEGLFASEFYTFGWIVGLGGYLAYAAAGTVAGDLRTERMDMLVAGPVPRAHVLVGKYLALLVPIAVLNVVTPLVLYGGSRVVGEPMALADLAALHALAVPYLLCWSAVGLLLGAVVRGGRTAGRLALGLVFGAWIVDSVLSTTDYAAVGRVVPTHYFDPPTILIEGQYDLAGAAILLAAAALALAVTVWTFQRSDL